MTKTVLVLNTHSNRGAEFARNWEQTKSEHGLGNWQLEKAEKPHQLLDKIRKAKATEPDVIIVGGGDGTVNAVCNELTQSGISLGILPLGTSNLFARSIGLPEDIPACIQIAKKGKTRPVSLGKINERLFVALATIGFSVSVSENVSDETKSRFGRFGYVLSSLWHGLRHRAFTATIETTEGQENIDTHQLLIANSEIAFPTDITFGVDAFTPKIGIISYADTKYKLAHLKSLLHAGVGTKPPEQTYKLSVTYAEIATSTPKRVAVDGEPFGETPITITAVKDAVNIVVD